MLNDGPAAQLVQVVALIEVACFPTAQPTQVVAATAAANLP